MYSLAEGWAKMLGELPASRQNDKIICVHTDGDMTMHANRLQQESMACYMFTLVIRGWFHIVYNGQELYLKENDVYTYNAGTAISIIAASTDYQGICLLADQDFALNTPVMKNAAKAAYFSMIELKEPKVSLDQADAMHLLELMQLMARYYDSEHPYRRESMEMLYGLFLLDLIKAQEKTIENHRFSNRVVEIYLDFIKLASKDFIEHHDISHYANQLAVTTTYLSRIVKQVSGRTIVDHINILLANEAVLLLQNSSMSVAQIAEQLSFAETTTFARFFKRMKGKNPKEFRNQL
jgi:AraC-like DNA-binding protein